MRRIQQPRCPAHGRRRSRTELFATGRPGARFATGLAWVAGIPVPQGASAAAATCGTTGDYGYGAWGHYGESQFGGGAEEDPDERPGRRRLTPEEYWQRYFAPATYQGRTRGEDTGDRFVPSGTRESGAQPAHRMAGPSRHPLAPRGIRRSDAQLYEDICEALMLRDDVDSSDVTVAVREGEVVLDGSVPQRSMRYLIEDLAAGHPAVRDVDNRVRVRKA